MHRMPACSMEKVKKTYDAVAENYAAHFFDELAGKPLDRLLLQAFARQYQDGLIADLGCGPGQTTRFLSRCGVQQLIGIDLSPVMIQVAARLNADIKFREGDLLHLDFPDSSLGGAIAFYAIVHFSREQVHQALSEVYRSLQTGGAFLFSFHIGTETVHRDELLDHAVDIDFFFFETDTVLAMAQEIGFRPVEVIERYPYETVEFPSKRAYLWLLK